MFFADFISATVPTKGELKSTTLKVFNCWMRKHLDKWFWTKKLHGQKNPRNNATPLQSSSHQHHRRLVFVPFIFVGKIVGVQTLGCFFGTIKAAFSLFIFFCSFCTDQLFSPSVVSD
jgi:hypothetical protein